MNEAEPLEQDVAIDPEMLGKVFENLIEENRRRGLGTFYTPREIVHYMCQESLVQYLYAAINSQDEQPVVRPLEIQEGLFSGTKPKQSVFRLPATENISKEDLEAFIHSGEQAAHYEAARMAGTVSYRPRLPSSIEANARLIDEHLRDIAVCDPAVGSGAFLVGMMTEIVRARSALTPYLNGDHDRTPYHFKRNAIQSCLYGVDIDGGAVEIAKLRLWLSLVVDEEQTRQIKPLPNLGFKIVTGNSLIGFPFKSHRLREIEALKALFFEETDHDRKAQLKRQIDRMLTECFAASKSSLGYEVNFDIALCFSEVFNAKTGFDTVIANPPYIDSEGMTKDNPQLRQVIQASYSMTKGNWDIYIAFYEKGFGLLGNRGVLSFITPDKWISKPFGDEMRARTTDRIYSILKAGRDVFENVNVDAIVSLFLQTPQPFLRIYEYVETEIRLKRIIEKNGLKAPYAYDWLFSDSLDLLTKIAAQSGTLADVGVCENACATSDAYKLQEFIEEQPNDERGKEYLRIINTGTIGKYVSKWGLRAMVYLGHRYTRPVVDKKQFLQAFKKSYGTKAIKQKLIIKGLNLLDACLDPDGTIIPGKTTLIITADNLERLKLVLGIINSAVAFFYLREKYPASSYNQGTTFTKEMINDLPVPRIGGNDQDELVSIVDRILGAKQRDPAVDTSGLQRELDRLVYRLYGLTKDEIGMLEGRSRIATTADA